MRLIDFEVLVKWKAGVRRQTYLEFATRVQPIIETHRVHKGIDVSIFELEMLSKVQRSQSKIWTLSETRVCLFVKVGEDGPDVVGIGTSKEIQPVQKIDHGPAQMSANDWLAHHPREEISRGNMISESLFSTALGRGRHVELAFSRG